VQRHRLIRVRARFSAVGALRREPRCDDDPSPLRTSSVSPPVAER